MSATATRMRRTSAPKADTATHYTFVHGTKIHTGLKARIVRAAVSVKTFAKRSVAAIASSTKALARKALPVAKATTKTVGTKVVGTTQKLWSRSLRPLLRIVAWATALTTLVAGAILAPLTTVLVLLGMAATAFALAALVEVLEEREAKGSRGAGVAMRILDGAAWMLIALEHVVGAAILFALCATDLPFAIFTALFLALSYFQVRRAGLISFAAFCVLSGNWGLLVVGLLLRKATRQVVATDVLKTDITPADAPNNPETWTRGNFLRAQGTEELWGTEHDVAPSTVMFHDDADEGQAAVIGTAPCRACGSTTQDARYSLATDEGARGLCTACFDALCEAEALKFTGVSLKARNVRIPLLRAGIEARPEFANSKADPDHSFWFMSAMFRTRTGVEYPREWGLLDNGDVVGTVTYDHKAETYTAEALGVVIAPVDGSDRRKEASQRLVADIVNDARQSLARVTEAVVTPLVSVKKV